MESFSIESLASKNSWPQLRRDLSAAHATWKTLSQTHKWFISLFHGKWIAMASAVGGSKLTNVFLRDGHANKHSSCCEPNFSK